MAKQPASNKKAAQTKTNKKDAPASVLKGWDQISAFLGEPPSVVQRWASEGMPVRKQGRYVETTAEELNAWLGKESGKPVHTVTGDADLTEELKRGLSLCATREETIEVVERLGTAWRISLHFHGARVREPRFGSRCRSAAKA